jgi:hypothetical protein
VCPSVWFNSPVACAFETSSRTRSLSFIPTSAPLGAILDVVREAEARVPLTNVRTQAAEIDHTVNQEIVFARLSGARGATSHRDLAANAASPGDCDASDDRHQDDDLRAAHRENISAHSRRRAAIGSIRDARRAGR